MKVQVSRWGNSTGMRFPKSVVDDLRLTPGSQLELVLDGDEIRLKPLRKMSSKLLREMAEEAKRLGSEYEPETVEWGADRASEFIDDDDPR